MMSKSLSSSQRGSLVLNVMAIALTVLPVLSTGIWTYQTFFNETRHVANLGYIEEPSVPPQLFIEPIITLTFDDGWESIYENAAALMSEYDMPSTQYILPGEFRAPNYMSAAQAESMKKAGHEITSHTYTHRNLTTISQTEIEKELDQSLDVLKKLKLLDSNDLNFAAPNGETNTVAMKEIKKRFASSRNVMGDLAKDISDNDMNVSGKFDRYNIIGYTVGQYTTDEQLRQALKYAREHNAWFIPVYHQIDDSGDKYSVSKETFKRHLDIYKESKIRVATMRDVLTYNKEAR